MLSSERNSPELSISSGSADSSNNENEISDDGSEEGLLLDPIWDQSDDVFRCTVCSWEVTDGLCNACMMEFKWDEVPDMLSLLGYSQPKTH